MKCQVSDTLGQLLYSSQAGMWI